LFFLLQWLGPNEFCKYVNDNKGKSVFFVDLLQFDSVNPIDLSMIVQTTHETAMTLKVVRSMYL